MADGDSRLIEQRPNPRGSGGSLGRHLHHDPRNRSYPVRGVVFADDAPLQSRSWYRRGVFDQGSESSCTAQTASGLLVSSPFRMKLDRSNLSAYDEPRERSELYIASQKVDPYPGEDYEGTSSDAPYRVLRARGQIQEWRWCFGIDDVLRTISHYSPVGVGTNWHEDMDTPDDDGFVTPTGPIRGGHEYELVAVNVAHRYVIAVNSWSLRWGKRGRFRMSWDSLDALLETDGDAVTIVL